MYALKNCEKKFELIIYVPVFEHLPSLMTIPPLISEVVATPPGTLDFSHTWTSNFSGQRDKLYAAAVPAAPDPTTRTLLDIPLKPTKIKPSKLSFFSLGVKKKGKGCGFPFWVRILMLNTPTHSSFIVEPCKKLVSKCVITHNWCLIYK